MGQWEKRRESIQVKGVQRFRFPEPVALLLATAFEPRTDGRSYHAALNGVIEEAKDRIVEALNEMAESGILSETGRIENTCLEAAIRIRKVANAHGAGDVVTRLSVALAAARGDTGGGENHTDYPYPVKRVPEPKYVREGRPPVGRWR